jgi:hypothetical protein
MEIALQELELILEDGFSDIDPTDQFQISVKCNLGLFKCPRCNQEINLYDYCSAEDADDYAKTADVLRRLGWGFEKPATAGLVELDPLCESCLSVRD